MSAINCRDALTAPLERRHDRAASGRSGASAGFVCGWLALAAGISIGFPRPRPRCVW